MAKQGGFFVRLCYGYVGKYKDTSKMTAKEVVEEFLKRKGVSSPREFFEKNFEKIKGTARIRLSFFSTSDKQFGKKVGKHATEFGLDPSNPEHREEFKKIIDNILKKADKVKIGYWRGQPEEVLFYVLGEDVVITKQDGEFVSVFKGGANNKRIKNARIKKI